MRTAAYRWRRNVLATLLACLFISSSARASDDPREELQQRMAELTQSIDSARADLKVVEARISDIEGEIRISRTEANKLKAEEARLSKDLSAANDDQRTATDRLSDLQRKQAAVRAMALERLRVLYMNPPAMVMSVLLREARSDRFAITNHYLKALQQHDRQLLLQVAALHVATSSQQKQLASIVAQRRKLVDAVRQRQGEVRSRLADQELLAKKVSEDRKKLDTLMGGLQAELVRFETVLSGMTGGADTLAASSSANDMPQESEKRYEGSGLNRHLVAPVEGKIIARFGSRRPDGSLSKGVRFLINGSNEVHAVAAGKVAFVGPMPGLGQVVVLDHGLRQYTLYALLSSVSVQRNAVVAERGMLGTATLDSSDEGTGNFYFEVRNGGQAMNPASYLDR